VATFKNGPKKFPQRRLSWRRACHQFGVCGH
jgi:hypothetical protein